MMRPLPNSGTKAIKHPNSIRFSCVAAMILSSLVFSCSSDKAVQPKHYPEEGTPQATLYITICGQCHAAPLPSAHTANIWPSVLDRMLMRMKANNAAPVTREEMSIIFGYLQQHAQKQPNQPSNQLSNQSQAGAK